ncbi:Amino acid transporter, transmembrane [Cynara cardunculus var. scolymus]|uniref:Amino acid transporter, transmembrane n=1 Tax=Cynara cardunculus var. scolymus TaxID=59895 RepID=A0A103Y6C2_CYNCS|nr:Amino acid transporter, transmembrane [Cynara cardunculus var. scolymus]
MSGQKQAEDSIISSNFNENEHEGGGGKEEGKEEEDQSVFSMKNALWHGGSSWDAWFSCSSNQVAQVLLTLPYSFSQLGMVSGIVLQIFYGILGSWTAYLISVLYIEYRNRKEKEGVSFKNHVIQVHFSIFLDFLHNKRKSKKKTHKFDLFFSSSKLQWFEVLDGLLGPYWKAIGLAFNCTFLLFGSVIQLIACARFVFDPKYEVGLAQISYQKLTVFFNIYYINDHLDKRTWTYIFGACCATTVFIPSFHNYRIWSFLGLGMTTYTAWYMAIAALIHGQVDGVQHSGPKKLVLYFTGATNILYTFGGHAVTVEIMHAMWKPRKFKYIYLIATLYVFTLTLPSASAVYWAFGDKLLNHSNAFSLLPKTRWRDAAFITFGFACTPLYFVWEKVIGMHDTKSICLRALARLPVVVPIWFLAIIFPFFGPINSAVGALLVSFTVYIIPSLAHMLTYRTASARQNAAEKPPRFMPSWACMYVFNMFVVVWVLVVGFGFGGWASVTNFVRQVDTFGLFAKCYQCKPTGPPLPQH